jgi:hypothetical protein
MQWRDDTTLASCGQWTKGDRQVLWMLSRRLSTSICRPVLPQEQTSLLRADTSASCHFRTYAPQQTRAVN